jgi:hypothetical protein
VLFDFKLTVASAEVAAESAIEHVVVAFTLNDATPQVRFERLSAATGGVKAIAVDTDLEFNVAVTLAIWLVLMLPVLAVKVADEAPAGT